MHRTHKGCGWVGYALSSGCAAVGWTCAVSALAGCSGASHGGLHAAAGTAGLSGTGASSSGGASSSRGGTSSGGAGVAGTCSTNCGERQCGSDACGNSCGKCSSGQTCTTDGLCISAQYSPGNGPLKTRWAADVDPSNPLPEYPRPTLVRDRWQSLNGLWEYRAGTSGEATPVGQTLPGTILVPYPIESSLSGVMKTNVVDAWYRRRFIVPADWPKGRVLLHFGAVDWESEVFVNGTSVGIHRGGYDAFSYDITDQLKQTGEQELIVRVHDATDQTRGKQSTSPNGIWYTATTGIWQSVWLEPVPAVSIARLETKPDVAGGRVTVVVHVAGSAGSTRASVSVAEGSSVVGTTQGALESALSVSIPSAKLWSPDSPFLYDLTVSLEQGTTEVDRVRSYFGMRSIDVANVGGVVRPRLNGKPIFMLGPLDQGFWPDGIYTAPTDAALRFDLDTVKALGLNMVRKHIKVEPERWYSYADQIGILVWQDMPSYGSGTQFDAELAAMVTQHTNHPSIVVWIPFNEGWGQHETERIVSDIRALDPTRLITPASGWNDVEAGDIQDMHCYNGPCVPTSTTRARVNGEFGGWGLGTPGHQWSGNSTPYNGVASTADLMTKLLDGISTLTGFEANQGLSGAVYTQLTDVEGELNGFLTYDRAVSKVDPSKYAPAVRALIAR